MTRSTLHAIAFLGLALPAYAAHADVVFHSAARETRARSAGGFVAPVASTTALGAWNGISDAPGQGNPPWNTVFYPGCTTIQTSSIGQGRVDCAISIAASSTYYYGYYNSNGNSTLSTSFTLSQPTPYSLTGSWHSGIGTDVGETPSDYFTVLTFGPSSGPLVFQSYFATGNFGNHTAETFALSGVLPAGTYGLTAYLRAYGVPGALNMELLLPSPGTGAGIMGIVAVYSTRRRR